MKLTIDQVNTIIKNGKEQGLQGKDIFDGLIKRGYEIEGVDTNIAKQAIQQKENPQIVNQSEGKTGLEGIATGVGKGVLSTVRGLGEIGTKIGETLTGGLAQGSDIYKPETELGKKVTEVLTPQTTAEKIGKFGEQVAEFAIPASKVSKMTEGASMVGKIIPRAIASGTVATAQQGEVGEGTGIAVGAEVALPYIAKPVAKLIGGIFKGAGSAVSGVGEETLNLLHKNAQVGIDAVKEIKNAGQEQILKDNVKTYMDAFTKLGKQRSIKFEKALTSLSKTDIKPKIVKQEGLNALSSNGINISKNGIIDFSNSEILNPQVQKKASTLIAEVNKLPATDGNSLRNIIKKLEASKLKSASVDPDRIAFNQMVDDLIGGFQTAINKSTNKLIKANAEYTQSKGLTEAIQKVLGKIKFKNQSEILDASKKMETIIQESGLGEDTINEFFKKAGINPEVLKTKEAVRQITTQKLQKNTIGANPFELLRVFSSRIITPKMVRNAAILTGKSEDYLKPLLEKTKPEARAILIQSMMPQKE